MWHFLQLHVMVEKRIVIIELYTFSWKKTLFGRTKWKQIKTEDFQIEIYHETWTPASPNRSFVEALGSHEDVWASMEHSLKTAVLNAN